MKTNILVCVLVVFLLVPMVSATTYYASPEGTGDECSQHSPCRISRFWDIAKPGDTLYLLDGVYNGSDSMIIPPPGLSGEPEKPITVKALNDGQAIIDGENKRMPCVIAGNSTNRFHDIIVEGIVCKNSNYHVFSISRADRVILRNVSAYNADPVANAMIFSLYLVSDVLLEDTAAYGTGRKPYQVYGSDNVTVRRCWAMWKYHVDDGTLVSLYHTNNSIVENCVGTVDPGSDNRNIQGITCHANNYPHCDKNLYIGNVVYNVGLWAYKVHSYLPNKPNIQGNTFINNVAIDSGYGFSQRGDIDLTVSNLMAVNVTYGYEAMEIIPEDSWPGFLIKGNLTNSLIASSSTTISVQNNPKVALYHDYNNVYSSSGVYYRGTSEPQNEMHADIAFDTTILGKGAYLMVPDNLKGKGENGADIGAEVLYQYENGVLTDEPLWPWPMENRICKETGFSVTWEDANTSPNGCGGGLWKTLDGVYPESICGNNVKEGSEQCDGSDDSACPDHCQPDCTCQPPECSGICKANPCSSYNDCAPLPESCSSGFCCSGSCTSRLLPNTVAIKRTNSPPAIDGNCSEYHGSGSITITPSQGNSSGTYWFLWDSEALYVCGEVLDSEINTDGTDLYNDDSMELFLDAEHDRGSWLSEKDFKVYIDPLNNYRCTEYGSNERNVSCLTASSVNGTANNNSDSDLSYTVEMKLAFSDMAVQPPSYGDLWGLDLSLNDRDSSFQKQNAWANTDGGGFNDPDGWGDALFVHRADSSMDGCVDSEELASFIDLWLSGGKVSLKELVGAVKIWMGC